ncbi:MAG: DUF4139 domain-containing protein [Planctomycetes bacterium]|nr:DUF4139 domain-containing protein [Planctomycetota bacterium]
MTRRCVALAGVLALAGSLGAGELKVAGKIEQVTLYRGQAMVMRVVPVDAPAGPVELVVTGLPEQIVPESLYASTDAGAEVRAVRYRPKAVAEVPREEVKQLLAEMEKADAELRKLQSDRALLGKQGAYLAKLQDFVAPTAQVEITKGVLNAEQLEKLTTMMFDRHKSIEADLFALGEKEAAAKKNKDLLQRRVEELTRGRSRTEREAVVFLDKAGAGAASVRLHYLVSNAAWAPSYNLRAKPGGADVKVEYSALAQQMSGEDWNGVELTLSTATAVLVADSLELAPLWVSLVPRAQAAAAYDVEKRLSGARGQLSQLYSGRRAGTSPSGEFEEQWEMNKAAAMWQDAELTTASDKMRTLQSRIQMRTAGLSVNYKIPGRVSVASRADQQMVRIAELTLPAKFYNVATPLLTEYVYRQADLVNTSETALLEGSASVYLDGEFVGKGTVPMCAPGQKLVIGFGVDPQLRAWREFISKSEATQGGNKEVTFKYRLVLDNYKDKPATVRAFDRMPYGENIRGTVEEGKDPLSTDKEYLRAFRPHGILRWDVEVPPKSAAETARIVEYTYKIEFDRNLDLSAIPTAATEEKAKASFMELKR